MKIKDVFHIKGRGKVLATTVDIEVRHKGAQLVRLRDGASWKIRGVERFANRLSRETLGVGERVGFLVPDGCDLEKGDEVAVSENEGEPHG